MRIQVPPTGHSMITPTAGFRSSSLPAGKELEILLPASNTTKVLADLQHLHQVPMVTVPEAKTTMMAEAQITMEEAKITMMAEAKITMAKAKITMAKAKITMAEVKPIMKVRWSSQLIIS